MKKPSLQQEIDKSLKILLKGGVIVYPTDTIWGIGCDATNERAVQRIMEMKKRPSSKGFIVLVDSEQMLKQYVRQIPELLRPFLLRKEKPTTIIYPDIQGVVPLLCSHDGSLAVRLTYDPFCRELIRRLEKPLVSTSANYSGDPAPASFRDIPPGLLARADHVVSWRQDEIQNSGPSTIIKVLPENKIRVIRK